MAPAQEPEADPGPIEWAADGSIDQGEDVEEPDDTSVEMTKEEFLDWVRQGFDHVPGRTELLQMFGDLDVDGDGWLTYEEAKPFLDEQGRGPAGPEPMPKALGPKGGHGGS